MNVRKLVLFALPVLAVFGLAAPAVAAPQGAVQLSAEFAPPTAKPGDTVTLKVTLAIDPGWHVYGALDPGMPTTLSIGDPGGLVAKGGPVVPAGKPHETAGMVNYWVDGTAELTQEFVVPEGAAGEVKVKGTVDYMVCTPERCDPPASDPYAATLTVAGGGEAPPVAEPAAQPEVPAFPDFQDPMGFGGESKIMVTARVEPSLARPGERVKLVVTVDVDMGWHVYGSKETESVPTTLELRETGALQAMGVESVPPGESHEGATAGYWLSGSFEIEQWLLVPEDAAAGDVEISGAVAYMPCTESSCLAPADEPFQAALAVEAGAARAEHVPPEDVVEEPGTAAATQDLGAGGAALKMSLLALILASIGGGLFALAMPCTYPMIPITVSFFTKQAEKRGGNVLSLALVYGAGIVAIFAALGAIVAAGLFGMTATDIIAFAGHWLTNTVLVVLFLVFALVLLGLVNLQPPQFLMNVANKASATGGYLGVFMMGATLVIASFTCTAPIVGTLLGVTVQSNPLYAILGMAIFGLTMAVPFVVLSLLPGKAKSMPRSGEWMHTLKVTLGIIELAAVLKFFSNIDIALDWRIYPRELYFVSWALVFFLGGMYLLGLIRGRGSTMEGVGPGRMTTALVFFCLTFYYLFGGMGFQLDAVNMGLAPDYSAPLVVARGGDGAEKRHVIVKDDYQMALRMAREDDKLVLINFTGFI